MARGPDERVSKANDFYKQGLKLVEIASQLNLPPRTVTITYSVVKMNGITLAGCFFDEVALMSKSFVNQATGRCSIDSSKFWFNCNTDGPYHWLKIN